MWVELQANETQASLVVGDDGVGLPAALDFATCRTLGMQLISDLTAQLHGTVSVSGPPGTVFTIAFPLAG